MLHIVPQSIAQPATPIAMCSLPSAAMKAALAPPCQSALLHAATEGCIVQVWEAATRQVAQVKELVNIGVENIKKELLNAIFSHAKEELLDTMVGHGKEESTISVAPGEVLEELELKPER
mmetsp:Transcript_127468/g.318283  ORF Transcript_127468/g.318283 Transcript_127468/m.318283 type:complete len:120 (-) Transcript_127468:406-765(-)